MDKVLAYVTTMPLVVFLLSGFCCLGFSAMYHLFWIHSRTVSQWMIRMDYGGICILIMGSSYPAILYGFACGPVSTARNFFIILITTSCSLTFLTLLLPSLNKGDVRVCRSITFFFLGFSAGLPLAYMFIFDSANQQFYLPTISAYPYLYGGIAYSIGATIFGTRVPEKYYPVRFDLLGASHQLFHVTVIIGFTFMFIDSVRLYQVSKSNVCPIVLPFNS